MKAVLLPGLDGSSELYKGLVGKLNKIDCEVVSLKKYPQTIVKSIKGPHLLFQENPAESANLIIKFLENI